MKKIPLALVTMSALALSGSALAAFADAPKGEASAADPQLEISGTLTNNNPNWMWQIPAASQAAVTDVALKKIAGVINGSNTEYSITKAPLSILEGYMKAPAPNGGAGLTPVIIIGGQNVIQGTCPVSQGGCTITIDAKHNSTKVGEVSALINTSAYTSLFRDKDGTLKQYSGGSEDDTTDAALQVLRNQTGYETTYPGPVAQVYNWPLSSHDNLLSLNTQLKISASRLVEMMNSKLVVPTNAIPEAWSATLPITISQK